MVRFNPKLLLSILLCSFALTACEISEQTRADIAPIRIEVQSLEAQLRGIEVRLSDIAAGSPAAPGEAEQLSAQSTILRIDIQVREDEIRRKKSEDRGNQFAWLQYVGVGLASMVGLGGVVDKKFGKSRSDGAVAMLQDQMGKVAQVLDGFRQGMQQPIPPAVPPVPSGPPPTTTP